MSDEPELTTTLQALIDQEQELLRGAPARLGNIVGITEYGLALLNTAIFSISAGNEVIAGVQLAIQKSATLAYLSYCRCHSAQAEFNCRQMIEYACLGAYLLANPGVEVTRVDSSGETSLVPGQKLRDKAYAWIAAQMPELSRALKDAKGALHESAVHGSLHGTSFTMSFEQAERHYKGSFFDNVGADWYRASLLRLCDIIAMSIAVIRQANEPIGVITYREETGGRFDTFVGSIDRYRQGYEKHLSAHGLDL